MTINWGILGAGGIGGQFANALRDAKDAHLVAVGSRDDERARRFAAEHEVPRTYGTYEAFLDDADIDVVYIASVHPQHEAAAIACARAGKHVLCEKPLTMNAAQAERVIAAARTSGVFLMEAFMYRCHPQIARVLELIEQGAIGEPLIVRATFGFRAPYSKRRLFDPALGGGAILDIGCYTVSMARLIAGEEPDVVTGTGRIHDGVDEWALASLRFPGGMTAQLACATRVEMDNSVDIFGSDGLIKVPYAWGPEKVGPATVVVNGTPEAHDTGRNLYAHQADLVGECIAAGMSQAPHPAPTWDDTLGNMRVLDRWRDAITA